MGHHAHTAGRVRACIDRLPEAYRAVRVRLHRARQALRALLGPALDAAG